MIHDQLIQDVAHYVEMKCTYVYNQGDPFKHIVSYLFKKTSDISPPTERKILFMHVFIEAVNILTNKQIQIELTELYKNGIVSSTYEVLISIDNNKPARRKPSCCFKFK
jgi:hypothetical protein